MRIELISNKDNVLEIIVRNEGHTLLNLIVDELNRISHVEYATYALIHPLEKKVKMIVMTDGNITPLEAIKKAISDVDEKISELRKGIQELE